MTLNSQFDALAHWARANICDKIKFKKAADEESTVRYDGEYVHPAVFSFFAPRPSDARRLGLDYLVPSCCVQLLSGEDHLSTSMRELRVRLLLAVWNPGLHKDIDTVAYTDLDDDYGFDFHRPFFLSFDTIFLHASVPPSSFCDQPPRPLSSNVVPKMLSMIPWIQVFS